MSLYRNSVISQVPVNFRHANALRRESLTRASSPGLGLLTSLCLKSVILVLQNPEECSLTISAWKEPPKGNAIPL